jgi:hypothetical protein
MCGSVQNIFCLAHQRIRAFSRALTVFFMTPQDALQRLSDDDWHAHAQSGLTQVDELIDDAKARVAEHAAHMATLEKTAPELMRFHESCSATWKKDKIALGTLCSLLARSLCIGPALACSRTVLRHDRGRVSVVEAFGG